MVPEIRGNPCQTTLFDGFYELLYTVCFICYVAPTTDVDNTIILVQVRGIGRIKLSREKELIKLV